LRRSTFLNLDQPYPKEVFTILIWGLDLEKFGSPQDDYKGLRVCVTGKITSYRGRPEIVATERGQIEVQKQTAEDGASGFSSANRS
jgi:hypothetical protein